MNIIVFIAQPGQGIQSARNLVNKAGLQPDLANRTFSAISTGGKVAAYFKTDSKFSEGEIDHGLEIRIASQYPELPSDYKKLPASMPKAENIPEALEAILFSGAIK